MGNYTSNVINTDNKNKSVDPYWFKKLQIWENDIKIRNRNVNNFTNNSPTYMNKLDAWAKNIKFENFRKNVNCNNAPKYIINLRNENQKLKNTYT